MKTITVHKAYPLDDGIQPPVTIKIELPLEDAQLTMDTAAAVYGADAELLFNALWGELPGGTLDRLIVMLLERKASLLAVPHKRYA